MKCLIIGSGMMGSAAAFDMACTPQVDSVTLADSDVRRAREVCSPHESYYTRQESSGGTSQRREEKAAAKLMRGYDAVLSAVPYFLNLGLARAAVGAMPLRRSGRQQYRRAPGTCPVEEG